MTTRDKNLERAYRNLIARALGDEVIRAAEGQPILNAVGRTLNQFFDDVERARRGVPIDEILRAAIDAE